MPAVAKEGPLRVIPGDRQLQALTAREHATAPIVVARHEHVGLHPQARMTPDQFFERRRAIAGDEWKVLVGDREDASARPAWHPVIEDAGFERTRVIRLREDDASDRA